MLLQMMTPDLQHVTCRVIARLRLDRLGLNARRLPRPPAVRRSMQESGRVTPLLPHVLRQKVAGNEDCAVLPDLNSVTTPLTGIAGPTTRLKRIPTKASIAPLRYR